MHLKIFYNYIILTWKMATQASPMLSNDMAPLKGLATPALHLV